MPAPGHTEGAGEAWVWGDLVATLLVQPPPMIFVLQALSGQKDGFGPMIEYPYAWMVYYNPTTGPHKGSQRPIFCATLERVRPGALAASLGITMPSRPADEPPIYVKGLFTASQRLNLGAFEHPLTQENARAYFIDLMRGSFHLQGQPTYIGGARDIEGHPLTGWPARPKSMGCLGLFLMLGTTFAWAALKVADVI